MARVPIWGSEGRHDGNARKIKHKREKKCQTEKKRKPWLAFLTSLSIKLKCKINKKNRGKKQGKKKQSR